MDDLELSDDVLALKDDVSLYDDSEASELSEEEVLALNIENASDDSDNDSVEGSDESEKDLALKGSSDSEEEEEDDFERFDASWGKSKKIYYDADEVSDLEEAKEEEQEAIRLYKKRISQMTEEDFLGTNEYKAVDNYYLNDELIC